MGMSGFRNENKIVMLLSDQAVDSYNFGKCLLPSFPSVFLLFFWPQFWHAEIPRPGVNPAPQQQPRPLHHKGTPLACFHQDVYKNLKSPCLIIIWVCFS